MPIKNIKYDCLGSESFDLLGFKTEEDLNIEISKLIQLRSEFLDDSEINCSKY